MPDLPTETVLFIGGCADGKRLKVPPLPRIQIPRSSDAGLPPEAFTDPNWQFPQEESYSSDSYERRSFYFGGEGELVIYTLVGLSLCQTLARLIENYQPELAALRLRFAGERDRALQDMINAVTQPGPPAKLICAGCAAKLNKFVEFATRPNQSYGNCVLCGKVKYLREVAT